MSIGDIVCDAELYDEILSVCIDTATYDLHENREQAKIMSRLSSIESSRAAGICPNESDAQYMMGFIDDTDSDIIMYSLKNLNRHSGMVDSYCSMCHNPDCLSYCDD